MPSALLRKIILHLRYDPYVFLSKLKLATESSGAGSGLVARRTAGKIRKYGLASFFDALESPASPTAYRLFVSGHKRHDALNLYESIMTSSARTVLEFGSGVSTLVMAHALAASGRRGKVHAVESDAKWAELVTARLAEFGLSAYANVSFSTPRLEEFGGQVVASFEQLPNIRPDLIYVDGPDPAHVVGDVHGLTMAGMQFIVLKDVLLYEWSLYAGAKIILDGRLHNYRFLQANLKRQYRFRRKLLTNINEISLVR